MVDAAALQQNPGLAQVGQRGVGQANVDGLVFHEQAVLQDHADTALASRYKESLAVSARNTTLKKAVRISMAPTESSIWGCSIDGS